MAYRYETHLHTRQGSACGTSSGAEHARHYLDAGYQGIFVTDHFFRGNTAIDRSLPWAERIHRFCSGYEDAWEEGQKIGLDVFFGWEENFEGDEYLIYGLDKQFMLDHPEMEHWTRREQYDAVHAAGGCVIQAHPFRMRGYIRAILLGDRFADGVEAANAGNPPEQDALAMHYAREKGLYVTAGSDNHLSSAHSTLFGVELEERLESPADWVQHVLTRRPCRLLCPEDRFSSDVRQVHRILTHTLADDGSYLPFPTDWPRG